MLKVLLAYRCSEEGESNPFERVLPVGLGYIHSYLRSRGIPSVLANFSAMDPSRIRRILLAEQPDIVGLSTFTFNRSATLALVRMVRTVLPQARIVLGGPHPTHVGAPILAAHSDVDICVQGEGELTLERLVRTLADGGDARSVPGLLVRGPDGVSATGPASPIADLDSLPFPALYPDGHGVDPRSQYPYVVTSRGCPAACSFCSSPEFWGSRVRFRSAENILDELKLLRDRFGIFYVSFRDDVFTLNRKRIIDLCRGMIDRRLCLLWDCQTRVNTVDEERLVWMKRAGALILQYGIESGSQAILDRLQKGQRLEQVHRAADLTRRVGLVLSIYLITGVPGETEEDLRETEAMVRRIRPHDGIVTPLAVFPGTSLWDEHRARTNADDGIWESVGSDGVFVRPEPFTEEAILRLTSILEGAAAENAYSQSDFDRHRSVGGECYATDLMQGESLEMAGRHEDAKELYARLAGREPWNPWPYLRLGRMALRGDPVEADRLLSRAMELAPEFADVRMLKAEALRSMGNRAAADALEKSTQAAETQRSPSKPRSGSPSGKRGFQSHPPPRPVPRSDAPC